MDRPDHLGTPATSEESDALDSICPRAENLSFELANAGTSISVSFQFSLDDKGFVNPVSSLTDAMLRQKYPASREARSCAQSRHAGPCPPRTQSEKLRVPGRRQ